MKKIAIFQKDLGVGGIQKSLLNLLNNIDYKKYEVDLYLFDHNVFYKDEINKNVNVIYLKPYHKFNKVIFFNIVKLFKKCSIKKKYDVAIDFNGYANECAINTLKVNSKKKIIYVHNDAIIKAKNEYKFKILSFFYKAKYKYFDNVVAVSSGVKESLIQRYNIDSKKIVVIPNLINTKRIIEMSKEDENFEVNKKVINLVSVGRLAYQKGYDLLLKDFKNVIEENNKYHLYLIGSGPELSNLLKIVVLNNLEDYVTFLGNKENPYSIMKKMDAFLLTSRYEGQGMVLLEAKCLGLDLIFSKHLEKYNDGLKGSSNIKKDILKINKKNKKVDYLEKYNKDIIKTFNDLMEV